MANGEWRFLTERLTGTGNLQIPIEASFLTDVVITRRLSTPPQLTCTVPVEVTQAQGPDGLPMFRKRRTAIYAEDPNGKLYGGILENADLDGPKISLDAAGFSYYPKGQPYTEDQWWIDTDPLDLHKHIWEHLQGLPGGYMAVELDDTKSPVRVGVPDAAEGETSTAGPYRLNWWDSRDLGKVIDDLATSTPFDWEEEHYWDGEVIRHRIRRGYPAIGRRRHDGVRFELGANVFVTPAMKEQGSEYATNWLVLGEGEGRDRVAGNVSVEMDGPRWVSVIEAKSVRTNEEATNLARSEASRRSDLPTVTELSLRDHPNCPIGSLELGDEVPLTGWTGLIDLSRWVRVVGIAISPAKLDTMVVTVEDMREPA